MFWVASRFIFKIQIPKLITINLILIGGLANWILMKSLLTELYYTYDGRISDYVSVIMVISKPVINICY